MWCVQLKKDSTFWGKRMEKGKSFGQCIISNRLFILAFSKDLVARLGKYYIYIMHTEKMAQGEREKKQEPQCF